jgi:predicted DNA-binding transcriptional regulator
MARKTKSPSASDASTSAFGALGIGPDEERMYRLLLARAGLSLADIAAAAKSSQRATDRLLRTLQKKGLASRTPENPGCFYATAPDIVMDTLLLERQRELQRAQAAVEALKHAAAQHAAKPQMVELMASGEAERHVFHSMNRTARYEVLTLVRRPILISDTSDPSRGQPQAEATARGVAFRSIVDHDALSIPGVARAMLEDMRGGEDVRAVPELPFKMVMADRSLALLPLNPGRTDGRVLLARESALLDGLYALFEALWSQAAALSVSATGELEAGAAPGSDGAAGDLVALLAVGLNDKAIASELDVSTRTLDRRILKLMKTLGARTRFQAGWIAGQSVSRRGSTDV